MTRDTPNYLTGCRYALRDLLRAIEDLGERFERLGFHADLGYLETLARAESLLAGLPGSPEEPLGHPAGDRAVEAPATSPARGQYGSRIKDPVVLGDIIYKAPGAPATASEAPAAPSPLADPSGPSTAPLGPSTGALGLPRQIAREDFERLMREGAEARRAAEEAGASTRGAPRPVDWAFMERCKAEVASWPEWKRRACDSVLSPSVTQEDLDEMDRAYAAERPPVNPLVTGKGAK